MDNTLVYTDILNNNAYYYACRSLGYSLKTEKRRITRQDILKLYPFITDSEYKKIIRKKQQYFITHMDQLVLNEPLVNFLHQCRPECCCLWTGAEADRISPMVDYYKLTNLFSQIIFLDKERSTSIAKSIQSLCKKRQCNPEDILAFEDGPQVIQILKQLGCVVNPSDVG